jgi:hypothetical protein
MLHLFVLGINEGRQELKKDFNKNRERERERGCGGFFIIQILSSVC